MTRLTDMGIEPFLLSVSSRCWGAGAAPGAQAVPALPQSAPTDGRWHPVGCDHCGHSGYKGRTGVYELMSVDDKLRR